MPETINLMSDTVTHPTEEMRKAMYEAKVGDDVQKADPTVNELQELTAQMLGMEDALFMPSGTMGNLVALMAHCPAGREVFLEARSHINTHEGGGVARVAGLMPNKIEGDQYGILAPEALRAAIRPPDVHFPTPGLICIENTHNAGGGTAYPLEYLRAYREIADEFGLKFHMDGARIFNAAVYLGVDVKEIAKHTDSVMLCLSKGLSAPVGSMLCGTKEFIKEALRLRKMLGGGLRQVGVLAAAGIVALNQMTDALAIDHENARRLAEGLSKIDGISIDLNAVKTNILLLRFEGEKDANYFGKELKEKYQVLCGVRNTKLIRMVTNRHISVADVDYVLDSARKIMA